MTQMSNIAESIQGGCFHQEVVQELLIPQAETETPQCGGERAGESGCV